MRIDIDALTEAELIDLNNRVVERLKFLNHIGERTPDEQKYDHEVIRWLRRDKSISKAIAKANEKYPTEALQVNNDNLGRAGPLRVPGRPPGHQREIRRTQADRLGALAS